MGEMAEDYDMDRDDESICKYCGVEITWMDVLGKPVPFDDNGVHWCKKDPKDEFDPVDSD